MLQPKKLLHNSKQLPFYLLNIQWASTLTWAQLGVSSAGPAGITHAAGVAQLGPQT